MHKWGDDFDWEGLGDAIRIASTFMRRWGRIGVHSKEKYGTARLSTYFYCGGLHSLIYPGYVSSQWRGKWRGLGDKLWSLDCLVLSKFTNKIGLVKLIQWWQVKVYNWGYQKALKKYPELAVEIVCAADQPHMIAEWHQIMAPLWFKRIDELEERWIKTHEFYERTMKVLGLVDTDAFTGFKSGLSPDDISDLTRIVYEYEEYDKL